MMQRCPRSSFLVAAKQTHRYRGSGQWTEAVVFGDNIIRCDTADLRMPGSIGGAGEIAHGKTRIIV